MEEYLVLVKPLEKADFICPLCNDSPLGCANLALAMVDLPSELPERHLDPDVLLL